MVHRRFLASKKDAGPIVFFIVEIGMATMATMVEAPPRAPSALPVSAASLREMAIMCGTNTKNIWSKQCLYLLIGKGIEAHFVFGDQLVRTVLLLFF